MTLPSLDDLRVAIIGLGYVGLPLAVEFGRHFDTVGVDIDAQRIAQLRDGHDVTREVAPQELAAVERLSYTDNLDDAAHCDVYIITVPIPIDDHNQPDLSPLKGASESVGPLLNRGNIVIYESTVFPGATEEICVPLLEEFSGLRFNQDFFVGYSPERINPGDKEHGFTPLTEAKERGVYQGVILAVPHREFLVAEGESVRALGAENSVLFDVKSVLPAGTATLRL